MNRNPFPLYVLAVAVIVVCVYSTFSFLRLLFYRADNAGTHTLDMVSVLILVLIAFSVCGIIGGCGLFCRRDWARRLTMGVALVFFIHSYPGVLLGLVQRSFWGHTSELTVYLLTAVWSLYYLGRPDVRAVFRSRITWRE